MELERYACYVIADGLNDLPDTESARLATQVIILAFEERPSIKKRAILSYLEAANKALAKAGGRETLKASVTVVVTDYAKARYGYAGNTRRDGSVERTDSRHVPWRPSHKRKGLAGGCLMDALSRHEKRNNRYAYLGQGEDFAPFVSKKIKLVNGDIVTLYSRET